MDTVTRTGSSAPLGLDRRVRDRRYQHDLRDGNLTVECGGCDERPLASSALTIAITRPGAVRPSHTTHFCPRCAQRLAGCWYQAFRPNPLIPASLRA